MLAEGRAALARESGRSPEGAVGVEASGAVEGQRGKGLSSGVTAQSCPDCRSVGKATERLIFARAAKFESGKVAKWQTVGRMPYPIHPVNLSLGHGSDIHDVSGSGNPRAFSTVIHPSGNAMERTLPLRAIQRRTPQRSQI